MDNSKLLNCIEIWAGQTATIIDNITGEIIPAYVLVQFYQVVAMPKRCISCVWVMHKIYNRLTKMLMVALFYATRGSQFSRTVALADAYIQFNRRGYKS